MLFFTTVFSGGILLCFPKIQKQTTDPLLFFGGSFLFSLTLIDILPELYSISSKSGLKYIIVATLFGVYLQFFLDLWSHGVSHGHLPNNDFKPLPVWSSIGLLTSLSIHALMDGLSLGGYSHLFCDIAEHDHSHQILSAIILHKIPASFALTTILMQRRYNYKIIICFLLIFALASPLGCWIGSVIPSDYTLGGYQLLGLLWAVSVGSLLHIATTILSEATSDHKFNLIKVLMISLGAFFALLLFIF